MSKFGAFDFDGTCFDTIGGGVLDACEQAVSDLFGEKGVKSYHAIGGLQNRAPGELVVTLLNHANNGLLDKAEEYLNEHHHELQGTVPIGKGVPLIWQEPYQNVTAELFVRRKMEILMAKIGTEVDGKLWPQPTKGFLTFWREVQASSGCMTGILSSGHDVFIQEVFSMYDLEPPDVMVTDDDARLMVHKGEKACFKPDSRLMDLTWKRLGQVSGQKQKPATLYAGDCMKKDAGLAENSGVPFLHYGEETESAHPCDEHFQDWEVVLNRFV